MPAKKYYAFANGARVGIFYEFWKDVQHLNKVSKPIYKGFNNFEDAQKFMAENGVIVDELSSATELGLHKKRANSDEDQRSTTNQVQDISKRVNQIKRNCEVLSAKENLGPENDHHNTPYDNGGEEDHRITIQETPDCYESSERINDIPEIQSKAILEESKVPSLSGIEKSRDSADAWLSEMQKGPFRDELGEEQDMKDYVKEELTKIWITLSSLSLHVSECQCKNITSSSILELNNEREKNVRLEDEISSKEKEISDVKETIAILKEKEKSFKKTEYENSSLQSISPTPLFPKTPFTENSPFIHKNRFEALEENSFELVSKSYSQENESDKRIMIEVENLQRRLVNLEDRLSESLQKQNYAPTESKSSQASVKSQKKSRHSESKETKTSRPLEENQGDAITQKEKKSEVYVIGDSIVKNLDGRKMARKKNVKVRSFPGATTSDMTDFVKPIIRKKPESVILHVGTNDLKSNPEAQIADNIIELANSIRNQQINCVISLLTY